MAELDRQCTDPEVHVELYAAPEGCALDDEAAWRAANPTTRHHQKYRCNALPSALGGEPPGGRGRTFERTT